jgi:outer membrane lipoprotein-sorting protein
MKTLLVLAALAATTLPAPAVADPHAAVLSDQDHATLRGVETYLNGLRTLRASFLQTAPDGATSTGTAWLSRPGRMRFEYDPPSPLLLVAGHGTVVFRDNKLDQTTNIPMNDTPLGLLLRDQVTLTGDVTLTDYVHPPGQLQLTLVKTAAPGDGTLTLVLNEQPLGLAGWTVVDNQGRETRVRLSHVQLGGTFDASLFTYTDPHLNDFNGNAP